MKRVKTEEKEKGFVKINVGGVELLSSKELLSKLSIFPSEGESIEIDCDGYLFSQILHYLRRGIPFTLIPPNVLKEVWEIELVYWGLVCDAVKEKTLVEETEDRMDHVILELMKISEMKERLLKGQLSTSVFIPYEYETEWGQSLANYLVGAKELFSQRLKPLFDFQGISMQQYRMAKMYEVIYSFQGKQYSTHTNRSLEICITRLF